MSLRIAPFADADAAAYAQFVAAQPQALLFHSLAWRGLLLELLGCACRTLLAVDDAGALRGVLPLLEAQGRWGRVLNSLPFYGSNGGVLALDAQAREALTRAYDDLVAQPGVAAATLIDTPLMAPNMVRCNQHDARIGQVSPIAYAQAHEEALMASFHYKTRNAIRKAEKLGVQVAREDDALAFIAEVHEQNMAAIGGRAKPRRFFALVASHFAAGTGYRIHVARLQGEPVAALLTFYCNETVEYFTPVVRETHRETQALSLVILRAMVEASQEGWRRWNWGGTWTSQEGVYRFKSRWGTQDHHYDYRVQVNEPGLAARTRAELASEYPYFYVLPYSTLGRM
jgi:hypothetical protein